MRIALLSDIHANIEALDACLAHARAQRRRHATRCSAISSATAPMPCAVVDSVMRFADGRRHRDQGQSRRGDRRRGGYFNEQAQAALEWARETLSDAQKRFLAGAAACRRATAPSCFVHASAAAPERWDYVDSPGAAMRCAEAAGRVYTFCGHVHDQMLYFETRRWPA